jgi:hypothetical protein
MATSFKFAMDFHLVHRSKDVKLIGKLFLLLKEDEDGSDLKAKLVDIDKEGMYVFRMTQSTSHYEEVSCKKPNTMMEIVK